MQIKDSLFRGRAGGTIAVDVKAVSEEGEFEGYGSIFGSMDQGRDVVVSGAFAKSLARRPAEKVKMLWQHRTDQVIGKWTDMREDAKGLFCRGRLFMGVQAAKECHVLMKEGAIDGLSIGYRTVNDEYDRDANLRRLTEVELMEVSVVTFPMHMDATVSLVKGDDLPTEREIETHLRDAGLSRSQAKAFVAGGYKSLKNLRDAGDQDEDEMRKLAAMMRGQS